MTTTDQTIAESLDFLTQLATDAARELTEPGARSCIVDGSHYAPSWRAINALGALWDADDDGETVDDINDALDRWESSVSLPNDASVYWEDGALFVELPDDDDDDDERVYLVETTNDDPYVFARKEDASAFALARGDDDETAVRPCAVIDAELAARMIADERNDGEPCVCAGTGNHERQSVDHCDECTTDEPTRGADRVIVVPASYTGQSDARLSIFTTDGESATMTLSIGPDIIARGESFRVAESGAWTWLDMPESQTAGTFGSFLAHALESSEPDARDGWSILDDRASDWTDALSDMAQHGDD